MIQDHFLAELRKAQVPVTIYLVSGIRLQGTVESSDQYGLLLSGSTQQFIFKRAISTIVPSREVTARSSAANAKLPRETPAIDVASVDTKSPIGEIVEEKVVEEKKETASITPVVRVKRAGGTKLKGGKSEKG